MNKTKYKKDLNKIYGIDWQQSEKIKYTCLRNNNYTINKIIKLLDLKQDNLNLIFVKNKDGYKRSILDGVKLDTDLKKISLIDTKCTWFIRSFCDKKEALEEIRNAKFLHIFSIEPDALNEVKPEFRLDSELFYNDDLNFRIKIDSEVYINSKTLNNNIDVMISGKKHRLDIGFMHGYISNTPGTLKNYVLEDFVDKSGYSLINHRNRLQGRLKEKQIKTLRTAIQSGVFLLYNNDLYNKIEKIKKIIAQKFKKTTNIFAYEDILNYSTQLKCLWEDFDKHTAKITKSLFDKVSIYSRYTSMNDVTTAIIELNERAYELQQKILRGE